MTKTEAMCFAATMITLAAASPVLGMYGGTLLYTLFNG